MEKLRPTVAQIRSALQDNPHVQPLGELTVVSLDGYNHGQMLGARTDFYVEPLNLPNLMQSDFASAYNNILRDMLPANQYPGAMKTFKFMSPLRSSPPTIHLGFRQIDAVDDVGKVKTTVETTYTDPKLQEQASKLGVNTENIRSRSMEMDVRVRLFVPGMGKLMSDYERGYYQDGNVVQWDQSDGHGNFVRKDLVWKGRYISMDELSIEQLQAIARGEFPFPKIEYLESSEFDVNPTKNGDHERVIKLLQTRLIDRNSDGLEMGFSDLVRLPVAS